MNAEEKAVYVIEVSGFADGKPCPIAGQFLEVWDTGEGDRTIEQQGFTLDLQKAMRFDQMLDAIDAWRRVSDIMPTRPDGEPNRPLTALNVHFRTL